MAALLPYQHTRIFGASAPGAAAPVHLTLFNGTTRITPRRDAGTLRVSFSLGGDSTLSLQFTDGTTTKTSLLQGGTIFTAGERFTVSVPFVRKAKASSGAAEVSLTYDFICGSDVAIDYFQVEEIEEAVS